MEETDHDRLAERYAEELSGELEGKPADRAALAPRGELMAAVHLGGGWLRPGAMWGLPVAFETRLFADGELEAAVAAAGFAVEEARARDPYPGVEYPTRRLLLRASAGRGRP